MKIIFSLFIILILNTCEKVTDPKFEYLSHEVTASKQIGPDGGTLTEPETNARIDISAGALYRTRNIEIGPAENLPTIKGLHVPNTSFHLGPDSVVFYKSVLFTIPYNPKDVTKEIDEKSLQIHYYNKYSNEWETVGDSVSISKNEIYGRLSHFSYYCLGGNIEPEPTQLLEPEKETYNSIRLKWTVNSEVDFKQYQIFSSTSPDVTFDNHLVEIIKSQNHSFTYDSSAYSPIGQYQEYILENLEPATTYYFKVFVFDKENLYSSSNEVSFSTEALNPLTAVTLYNPSKIYPSFIELDWSDSDIQNFEKYDIRYSKEPGVIQTSNKYKIINERYSKTEITDLDEGETYYFRVFVYDNKNNAVGSNEISVPLPYWVDMPGLIPDPKFELAIRYALDYWEDNAITVDQLETITKIDLSWYFIEISYLKGIEYCTSLEYLLLPYHKLIDLSHISDLTQLKEINIAGNKIEDIFPIENLKQLYSLKLWQNNIVNIEALSTLENLRGVNLSYNQINDILPLVQNEGFGLGDTLGINSNPLNEISRTTYIDSLRDRGVIVYY